MPSEKTSKTETRLWFDQRHAVADIRREIEANAQTLEHLTLLNRDFVQGGHFEGLKLPVLEELVTECLARFNSPQGWTFLHDLQSLRCLSSDVAYVTDDILLGLANAPWWQMLTHFEIVMLDLNKTTQWSSLWSGRTMDLETLCLFYLEEKDFADLLTAEFPRLQYLIVGSAINDVSLERLAQKSLPALEDLELRHSNISNDALRKFLHTDRPGLPKLKRVGKNIFSDRQIDYCDWNGAVVGSGNEYMTDSEVREEFFAGTTLTLLPSCNQVENRFASMKSSLALLTRPR